jgi:membrane dipeptidase
MILKNRMLILALLFYGPFVFSQKADKLHKKAIVADTHNDVISQVVLAGTSMEGDLTGKAHTDIARMISGGLDIQMFSIFCDERYGKGTAFAMANRQMDTLDNIISRHPDVLMKATSPAHIKKAQKAGKIACMMGVEGGHMMEDRLDYLDSLYKRGARYMTLTWNNSTSWATSAKDETENSVPDIYLRRGFAKADRGLDSLGIAVVKHMEKLGMMIDISHVGEATFTHVLKIATKPVIASHSSVYAYSPHRRNLKDYQLKAIQANGGVVFVNFYSGFLDSAYDRRKSDFLQNHRSERDSLRDAGKVAYEIDDILSKKYPDESGKLRPPLSILIDHMDYIVKLIGIDHVGLGSDFDGIESAPQGLEGVQDYPKITQALLNRGYSAKDIKKILGGNFMRILKATHKG